MIDDTSEWISKQHPRLILVIGIFDDENKATRTVEKLLEQDFAADRISLLHKASGPGDDMLGLIYANSEERVKIWSKYGIIWGALWGLLAAASSMFMLQDVSPALAVGPIVNLLAGVLIGAVIGGAVMASAAVLTEFASILHKTGIPKAELKTIHRAIEQGGFIVILHCSEQQAEHYTIQLRYQGAEPVIAVPIVF